MIKLQCPHCGSALNIDSNTQRARCEYCDSFFVLQDDEVSLSEIRKDDVYNKACRMMASGQLHFLEQAERLFSSISEWKDASSKRELCLKQIEVENQKIIANLDKRKRENESKIIRNRLRHRKNVAIVLLISVLVFVSTVWVVLSVKYTKKLKHDSDSVIIELKSITQKADNYHLYVYLDYEIKNNSKTTIDYIRLLTRIKDKEGKTLGTLTSEFGSLYSGSILNLQPQERSLEETYISELTALTTNFFENLYESRIEDITTSCEILYIKWSDGYIYQR